MKSRDLAYAGVAIAFYSSYLLYLFRVPAAPVVFCAACAVLIAWMRSGGLSGRDVLSHLMVWSVPVSYMNVTGGSYGALPISWFNLFFASFCIVILLESTTKGGASRSGSLAPLVFGFLAILAMFISTMLSRHIMDGLKDFANVSAFIVIAVGGSTFKVDRERYRLAWTASAFGAAIILATQICVFKMTGNRFGTMVEFPARTAYAGLFSDYSFASLYFASAACFAVFARGTAGAIVAAMLLGASMLTTARTGVISIAATAMAMIAVRAGKKFKPAYLIILGVIGAGALLALGITAGARGGQSFFADNGRIATFRSGWNNFLHSPLFGTGLGIENYASSPYTEAEFPHFTLLQLLAQTGVLGAASFTALVIALYRKARHRSRVGAERAAILCGIIGSFFIPDIMNSRFFPLEFIGLSIPERDDENSPNNNPL